MDTEQDAQKIIKNAPIAVGVAKKTVNTTYGIDLHTASAFEVEAFTSTFGSYDKTEGMTAFLEKRKPEFKNK